MTLNQNQFDQSVVQGQLTLKGLGENVISCLVSSSETAELVPGDAVTLEDSAGGAPKVLKATADSDSIFGFVTRNLKDAKFVANDPVEIAIRGSVMWMTSSAAVARQAAVEVVTSTSKVKTWAGTNVMSGIALDKASAANILIRVYIDVPGNYISLLSLPTMLPTTNGLIWVDQNRTDSYTADGTMIRPYKTLAAAITAANAYAGANAPTIMLPADTYTLTAAVTITRSMRLKGLSKAGDYGVKITSADDMGAALVKIIPTVATGTVEVCLEDLYLLGADLDKNILEVDNTSVAQKLKIKIDRSIIEYSANTNTGYGIYVTAGDATKDIQFKISGTGEEFISTVYFPVETATSGFEVLNCKFRDSTTLYALTTGTNDLAFFALIRNCGIPKAKFSAAADGHASQTIRAYGCYNLTDYQQAATSDFLGDHGEEIRVYTQL